jgi:hypothetical protein
VTERRAEKKAETSLGISSTKRGVAERHEYNKWQETLSGAVSRALISKPTFHMPPFDTQRAKALLLD